MGSEVGRASASRSAPPPRSSEGRLARRVSGIRSRRRRPAAPRPRQAARRRGEGRRTWKGLPEAACPVVLLVACPVLATLATSLAASLEVFPPLSEAAPVAAPGAAPLASAGPQARLAAVGEAVRLCACGVPVPFARPACAFRMRHSGPSARPGRGALALQGCRGCRRPRCRPGSRPRGPRRARWRQTARRTRDRRCRARFPSAQGTPGRRSRSGRRSGIWPSPGTPRALDALAAVLRRRLLGRRSSVGYRRRAARGEILTHSSVRPSAGAGFDWTTGWT